MTVAGAHIMAILLEELDSREGLAVALNADGQTDNGPAASLFAMLKASLVCADAALQQDAAQVLLFCAYPSHVLARSAVSPLIRSRQCFLSSVMENGGELFSILKKVPSAHGVRMHRFKQGRASPAKEEEGRQHAGALLCREMSVWNEARQGITQQKSYCTGTGLC